MTVIDHLVVAAERLDDGVAFVEDALGTVMPGAGGRHPLMGTHNRLMNIGGGAYLEVIAIDPDAPPPGRSRWFGLDDFAGPPRLHAWVARVRDLARYSGVALGTPTAASRGDLNWTITIPGDGRRWFDGAVPYLIEWGESHPTGTLPDSVCTLSRLTASADERDSTRVEIERMWQRIELADDRVSCADGDSRLLATFDTPAGTRLL